MDSRVTAENHPDDPFGMGTGPTYADRSFGPNQEVIARHKLRPGTDVLQTTRAVGRYGSHHATRDASGRPTDASIKTEAGQG